MRLIKKYETRYQNTEKKLFPTEFVVRWFKGTYPNWTLDRPTKNKRVLDLGFGDGRNFSLFLEQELEIFGVEISSKIVKKVQQKFKATISAENLKVGFNGALPFPNHSFDFIVACHSIYYMAHDGSIQKNLAEVARCLKKDALLLCSIPKQSSYLVKNSNPVDNYHALVEGDPIGLRDGEKVGYASSESDILELFSEHFSEITIGSVENNWWGITEDCWIVSCKKDHLV
ncbi:class I SAM-dependent methyltransferase [Alphaproteobacteria bacterium]|nr:class I SAM-dependent methyltransferase [Alphaproteobacteria bacterium]